MGKNDKPRDEKPGGKTDKPGSGPGGSKPNPSAKDKLGAGGTSVVGGPGRDSRQGPEGAEKTKGKPELKPRDLGTLEQIDLDIRKSLGADPFQDSFRPSPRRAGSGDERPNFLNRLAPPPVEEEVILPGDPSNLGARGRRRRNVLDVDQSPVRRRGLLGV